LAALGEWQAAAVARTTVSRGWTGLLGHCGHVIEQARGRREDQPAQPAAGTDPAVSATDPASA
jgi:hypothetical protein